jgi:hypothetical protein
MRKSADSYKQASIEGREGAGGLSDNFLKQAQIIP